MAPPKISLAASCRCTTTPLGQHIRVLPATPSFSSPNMTPSCQRGIIMAAQPIACRPKNRLSEIAHRGLQAAPRHTRPFSASALTSNWLAPSKPEKSKSTVGRPRMPTGGSMRGTTVVWGDYGLRMRDHDRRVSAMQLKIGEEAIRRRLRGMNYKLYTRVSANIGVYTKGNEVRMGKGKGKFDYWATRIPVSRVVFELKGNMHEKVIQEAFRLAGHKLPGLWEMVKKGDPPMVGITKLGNGVTLEGLKRARRELPSKEVEVGPIIPPATNIPSATNSPPSGISSTAQ